MAGRTLRDSRGRWAGSRAGYGRRLGDISKPLLVAGISISRQALRIPNKGPNTTIGKWRRDPVNSPMSRSGLGKMALGAMAAVAGTGAALTGAMSFTRVAKASRRPMNTHDRATKRTLKRYTFEKQLKGKA